MSWMHAEYHLVVLVRTNMADTGELENTGGHQDDETLEVQNPNLVHDDVEHDKKHAPLQGDPYQLVYGVKDDSSDSSDDSSSSGSSSSFKPTNNPLLAYLPGESAGSKELVNAETSSVSSSSEKKSREATPSSPDINQDTETLEKIEDDVKGAKETSVVEQSVNTTKVESQSSKTQPVSPLRIPSTSSLDRAQTYEPTYLYRGVIYLGSTTVNAPISEVEANRKIGILKKHSDAAQAIPINLLVPTMSTGKVTLKDPETDQPLATFAVKTILFCVRGAAPDMLDCFAFNVRHKTSGIFHCHVFQCENAQEVSNVALKLSVSPYTH